MEEIEAIRKLEDTVDIMTDMSTIKRSHRGKENENKFILSPAVVKEAIEAYNLFDRDSKGIDIQELATVFRAVGQNPTDAELREIMRKHDLNRSGRLTQEEFELMIVSYMKPMWEVEQELKDAFNIFDRDGSGTIDTAELEYVLKSFGEPLTHRQSKELIELMDKNGDGQVDRDDFVHFLCEVDQPDYFKKHYPDKKKGQSSFAKNTQTKSGASGSQQKDQVHQHSPDAAGRRQHSPDDAGFHQDSPDAAGNHQSDLSHQSSPGGKGHHQHSDISMKEQSSFVKGGVSKSDTTKMTK